MLLLTCAQRSGHSSCNQTSFCFLLFLSEMNSIYIARCLQQKGQQRSAASTLNSKASEALLFEASGLGSRPRSGGGDGSTARSHLKRLPTRRSVLGACGSRVTRCHNWFLQMTRIAHHFFKAGLVSQRESRFGLKGPVDDRCFGSRPPKPSHQGSDKSHEEAKQPGRKMRSGDQRGKRCRVHSVASVPSSYQGSDILDFKRHGVGDGLCTYLDLQTGQNNGPYTA